MIRIRYLSLKACPADGTYPENGIYIMDITERIAEAIKATKIWRGIAALQSMHTTFGLIINENESGLINTDFPRVLNELVPAAACAAGQYFEHDDLDIRTENIDCGCTERVNGHSHCKAIFLPTTVQFIVQNGRPALGKWQSILAVELDGPREERNLQICVIGE